MSKNLLLSIAAATLLSGTMMAQVADPVIPSVVTLTPYDEMGVNLPSVNSQITVTMDAVPNVPVTVMYITGNGFAMNMNYERISVEDKKTFTIPLSREKWGVPYNEVYYLNLVVTFTYGEGDEIEYYLNPETMEPVVASCMYMTADSGDARLELTFPNQQNIDNEMYSIAQAYGIGECNAFFSKTVDASASTGIIIVYDFDGEELSSSELIYKNEEWSDMDGLYQVNYTYEPEDEINSDDIARIEIQFGGVTYVGGAEMDIPAITLYPKQETKAAPRKNAKSKLSEELGISDAAFKIFNTQGSLINANATKTDVDALPSGLYIVNGKKVLIK